MRRSTRILIVAVLAVLALARVSALTAANTFAPGATAPYTEYTTITVTRSALGPTLSSLNYNLNPSRTSIVSVTLVLKNAGLLNSASLKFNNGSAVPCGAGQISGVTTYTYTCTPAVAQPTSGLTTTAVIIG